MGKFFKIKTTPSGDNDLQFPNFYSVLLERPPRKDDLAITNKETSVVILSIISEMIDELKEIKSKI